MHQNIDLRRRVLHGALVRLERSAVKVARCVLRGERSREAPDLPGALTYITTLTLSATLHQALGDGAATADRFVR